MVSMTSFSRMEYIDAIPFAENTQQTLRTNGGILPNDRFMAGLLLEFRGRLTMPAATGPSAVQGDAHAGIIERVTVEGFHRIRRQQEKFIDLRGAEIEALQQYYNPSALIKLPTTISITASATNDIVLQLYVPFTPMRVPVNAAAGYLLDAPNYESLKLTVQYGDFRSVVVPGTTAATWSAFGSTTGSPECRTYGFFALHPQRFAGFVPGRVYRYFQEITGSPMTTTANEVRVWDIPRGFDVRSVLLKTGVKATNTTAGNNSFASFSDFLTELRINLGLGKYIRRYLDGNANYADVASSYNLASRRTGINLIDFAQYGNLSEVLNTRPLISGPTGNVELYLQANVSGSANQAAVAVMEEIRYRPIMQSAGR